VEWGANALRIALAFYWGIRAIADPCAGAGRRRGTLPHRAVSLDESRQGQCLKQVNGRSLACGRLVSLSSGSI